MDKSSEQDLRPESEVGYGKPPKNTRFQKGQSGNPKGRPTGSRNLATILESVLNEKVVINEGGRRKTVTKLEAAVKQLANKAASGDQTAQRQVFSLIGVIDHESEVDQVTPQLEEDDQKVVQSLLKRLNQNLKGETES